MMRGLLSIAVLVTLVGCSREGGDTGSETEGTSGSSGTTDGVAEGCTCMDLDCGPMLCPEVTLQCDGLLCTETGVWTIDDEVALRCALIALRDRTPGIVQWTIDREGGGQSESVTLVIHPDGTARRFWKWSVMFGCSWEGPNTHATLRRPDYFEGCMARTIALARFLCMDEAILEVLAECTPGSQSCPQRASLR